MGGREQAVPLTDQQANVARLLSGNRSVDSYLAGGAAILIELNATPASMSAPSRDARSACPG